MKQTTEQPTPTRETHKVWIIWGSAREGDSLATGEYEFDTLEELNAFLQGVGEAIGWLDHDQFDTEEEFNAAVAAEKENDGTSSDS